MRRVSPSMAVALLALFVALGGTGIAASHYLLTSTKQIKPSVLRKLRRAGPRGPEGPVGPQGVTGAPGPNNLSALTTVRAGTTFVPPETVGSSVATCPAGQRAVSGGGTSGIAGIATSLMEANHQSWFVIVVNRGIIAAEIEAVVQCAGVGQAVTAKRRPVRHPDLIRALGRAQSALRTEQNAAISWASTSSRR